MIKCKPSQPGNEIWYATTDSMPLPGAARIGAASCEYRDGMGIIRFDRPIERICSYAFLRCSTLLDISIPEGVREIDAKAFADCSSLSSVALPNTLETIGDNAFSRCALEAVTIPESVSRLGRNAFSGCELLKTVIFNAKSCATQSFGFTQPFSGCTSLSSVVFGESVSIIPPGLFESACSLMDVSIGGSVASIGAGAFDGCGRLARISIPDSVSRIGLGAFHGASRLLGAMAAEGRFYKAFEPGLVCRGFKFSEDGINTIGPGAPLEINSRGFHYCDNPLSVFDYYCGRDVEDIVVCEVLPMGLIAHGTEAEAHRNACESIRIIRRLTFPEIFAIVAAASARIAEQQ